MLRVTSRKQDWWVPPPVPKYRVRVSAKRKQLNPAEAPTRVVIDYSVKPGTFAHSRHWIDYHLLSPLDAGYLVPLYDLKAIRTRYGLSVTATKYFRRYILPPPFSIVRRRAVNAHHWSKFVLLALDVVLKDLQRHGILHFNKGFLDHIEMLHKGVDYMAAYYAEKDQEILLKPTDKYGVEWFD